MRPEGCSGIAAPPSAANVSEASMSRSTCLLAVLFALAAVPIPVRATPTVPITGSTGANPRLQRDAESFVRLHFDALEKCSNLDVVHVEPIPGVSPSGAWHERWTAVGCGKRMPMDITFTPDGSGGTYIKFDVKKWRDQR